MREALMKRGAGIQVGAEREWGGYGTTGDSGLGGGGPQGGGLRMGEGSDPEETAKKDRAARTGGGE